MTQFTGQVALITGGGSGIGRATAETLARQGAAVMIANRQSERGEATVAAIRAAGGTAAFYQTDVTDAAQVQALIGYTVEQFGRLDIAFNNAGWLGTMALLAEQTEADFDRIFAVNVKGIYLCMKYELTQMLKQGGGRIINNASSTGVRNITPGVALYAATKSAVISLTKSTAMEYATQNIRINAVAPGRVRTEMLADAGQGDIARFTASIPMKRLGLPEEVANAVIWLASDQSSFITGHTVAVDGGFLAQ